MSTPEETRAAEPLAPMAAPDGATRPVAVVTSPSTATAALLAFGVLAGVNAAYIALGPRVPVTIRALHHVFDAGQMFALGALVSVAVLGFGALRARSPWLAARRFAPDALLGVIGIVAAYLFASDDFAGFASDAGGPRGGAVLLAVLLLVVGASPSMSWRLARVAVARARWAALPLGAAGLGLAVANGLVLLADYPGIHLFIAIHAVVLLTAAIGRGPLPARLRPLAGRRLAAYVPLAVLLVTLPILALKPNNAVRTQLSRLEGAVLVPILARHVWSTEARVDLAGVPRQLRPWMIDRRERPPVPPSGASLLPKHPIVILLGIDSVRADLFEDPAALDKMPNLVALRDRSLSFSMARSPGARTLTTWSQVFAGRYVSGLTWINTGNRLSISPDKTKRFSDYLRDAHVRTSTFVAYGELGKRGLARDFDEVVELEARAGQSYALSPEVAPELIASFKQPHEGARFYFVHFMDPHFPYDTGSGKGSTRSKFLGEVEVADQSVGKVWSALESNGLLDRTVLVVTADHGEALGEHGTKYHTVNLYEELIRVPLFIRIPGVKPRVIDTPVTLMDLGPTFLDLFSLDTPASFLGQSLLPFARGEDPRLTRPIAAERHGTRAMVIGNRKVIVDREKGRQELYDLDVDPDEAENLADDAGAEGQRLFDLVQTFFQAHAVASEEPPR